MGSNSSKPTDTSLVLKTELELGNSDPRSPTPEITRTPLQVSFLRLIHLSVLFINRPNPRTRNECTYHVNIVRNLTLYPENYNLKQ